MKAGALSELIRELIKAKHWERAEAVWIEAVDVIHSIEDSETRAVILSELAKTHNWERAESVWIELESLAYAIEDSVTKASLLSELGHALARAQQWKKAEAVAHTIENHWSKVWLLSELGRELTRARQWERAEILWIEAVSVAHIIEDRMMRAGMWSEISVRSFNGRLTSTTVLNELVCEFTKTQQWERAISIAHTIKDNKIKAGMLQEIAKVFARFGKDEQTLRLVQLAWLKADTRDYAINLLSLANNLIPLNSEIGTDFSEAFNWVDIFLKD